MRYRSANRFVDARAKRAGKKAKAAMNRRTAKVRGGFVLVMALALVVLAGFLLAGIARLSLDAALDAMKAREDLQLRWGAISCQRLFLDHADETFARLQSAGEGTPTPVAAAAAAPVEITLGRTKFRLRLADENCKTNVDTVFAGRGADALCVNCELSDTGVDRWSSRSIIRRRKCT